MDGLADKKAGRPLEKGVEWHDRTWTDGDLERTLLRTARSYWSALKSRLEIYSRILFGYFVSYLDILCAIWIFPVFLDILCPIWIFVSYLEIFSHFMEIYVADLLEFLQGRADRQESRSPL